MAQQRIKKFFTAKVTSSKLGRSKIVGTLSEEDEKVLDEFVAFATYSAGKAEAQRLKKYLFKIVTKILVFVQQGKIQPYDIDKLAKPANDLLIEIRKDEWEIPKVVRYLNIIQALVEGQLQLLCTGRTLERIDFLHEFFTNNERISKLASGDDVHFKAFRDAVLARLDSITIDEKFMTLHMKRSLERKHTERLDRELLEDAHRQGLRFKVLLLGAGESGKSTVMNQLRNIHRQKQPLNEFEIGFFKTILHGNTIESMKLLMKWYEQTRHQLDDPVSQKAASRISKLAPDAELTIDDAIDMDRLWTNTQVIEAFPEICKRYYVPDSSPYYFDNVFRFVEDDFKPSEEDTTMARIRTTGVRTKILDWPPLQFEFVDVGGQRSERKKWINFFDDVKAVFFVVNLAGYNKVTFEAQDQNRMHEALQLFEKTVNDPAFKDTPFFLFLNKKDLFEDLLRQEDITSCFPEYKGANTQQETIEFITQQFQGIMPPSMRLKGSHVIAARFKKDVKAAFEEVMQILAKDHEQEINEHKARLDDLRRRSSVS